MSGKPSAANKVAIELLAKFPGVPKRTIARRMVEELNNTHTIDQCRRIIQYVTGASGERHRKLAKHPLPKGVAGTVPKIPPSLSKPWVPLEINDAGNWAILSDIHAPYHDEMALGAALKYVKKAKPDGIILNGDIADFYTISRHQKDPTQRDLKQELEIVKKVLLHIRRRFSNTRIIFKQGNHEERWQHWLWNHAPEICDFPEMSLEKWLGLDALDIEYIGDKRPIMLGSLPVFHGHELPAGMASPVNPARGAFTKTISTLLVAHSHRTSSHTEGDLWHSEIATWSIGCLCGLNPEYAVVNKWNHGAAIVTVNEDKSFGVENLRISKKGYVRQS